jgi:hypothetical protein
MASARWHGVVAPYLGPPLRAEAPAAHRLRERRVEAAVTLRAQRDAAGGAAADRLDLPRLALDAVQRRPALALRPCGRGGRSISTSGTRVRVETMRDGSNTELTEISRRFYVFTIPLSPPAPVRAMGGAGETAGAATIPPNAHAGLRLSCAHTPGSGRSLAPNSPRGPPPAAGGGSPARR